MHATSTDLQNWDKHGADTFYADAGYSSDDFRDPYVFYNENEEKYWMLVTTRKNNMGVIALYKSVDLIQWKNEKVVFENDMGSDSNLECPTLNEWNGYWYLTFSDQWPDRLVHYRIAKSAEGPFEKPEVDYFDSNGLLSVAPIQSIIEKMNHNMNVSALYNSETITKENRTLHFSGMDYEIASYPKIDGSTKITGKIKVNDNTNIFGFAFNLGDNKFGTLNFVFNKPEGYIGFFCEKSNVTLKDIEVYK